MVLRRTCLLHYLRPVREVLQYRSLQTFRRAIEWQIPLFCPKLSCVLDPSSRRSCDLQFVVMRPIILRRNSPIPVGRTSGFLSNGTNLQSLYASSCSGAMASIGIWRGLSQSFCISRWKRR